MTLATLDHIALPADAMHCWEWDDDGQRCFVITEPVELDAAGHRLSVRVAGVQDYTGAVQRRVVLAVGAGDCELTAGQIDGLVAALSTARNRL
jgi:hypothetical protein